MKLINALLMSERVPCVSATLMGAGVSGSAINRVSVVDRDSAYGHDDSVGSVAFRAHHGVRLTAAVGEPAVERVLAARSAGAPKHEPPAGMEILVLPLERLSKINSGPGS